jgi:large subunit ribosomal protein L25
MATDRVKLEVRKRDGVGQKQARADREAGQIPGVIYRSGQETIAISVDARALRQAVTGSGGVHALMDVVVDGGRGKAAIIKDMQIDPVRDRVIHIDFHELRLDQKIATVVAVHLVGDASGVNMGGVLNQPTHQINVSVLPTEIPEMIEVDVSALEIGGSVRLSEVTVPEGVELLDDPESTVLATVSAPIAEEELEPEVAEGEEVEGEEGAEAGEGEEAGESGEGGGEEAPAEE